LFLASVESVQPGGGIWTAENHFSYADLPGGAGPGCAGYPPKVGLESVVNNNGSTRENVLYLKRCPICGEMHIRSGETCSRECLMILAEFEDFTTLRSVFQNSRWAGAPSQEEVRREYYAQRLRAATGRLPRSEDLLVEVLAEIIEDLEEVEAVAAVS
jgi:hypothetical protein